jgi:hypothetical protein
MSFLPISLKNYIIKFMFFNDILQEVMIKNYGIKLRFAHPFAEQAKLASHLLPHRQSCAFLQQSSCIKSTRSAFAYSWYTKTNDPGNFLVWDN